MSVKKDTLFFEFVGTLTSQTSGLTSGAIVQKSDNKLFPSLKLISFLVDLITGSVFCAKRLSENNKLKNKENTFIMLVY